jgi:IS30 family transposase
MFHNISYANRGWIITALGKDLASMPPEARRTITFDRGTEFAAYPA